MTLRIGSLAIPMPAVQAALSGYSDLPMRTVAREHGAAYALHEVVLDELVLRKGKLRRRILDVPQHDHPVGGQLMGSDPATFGAAARELVQAGFDVVDVNFGCPVNKVLGRCRGGWLLRDPANALDIVDSVVQSVGGRVPVTVKMRRGYDDSPEAERDFFAILEGAFERGISAVTVHPRTVEQKYVGPSRWPFLARVKRHLGARTVLGSGDLYGAFDVVRMMRETGVDGVTVARGCIGNPFVFGQVAELLAGRTPMAPTRAMQHRALLRHWELAIQHLGTGDAVTAVRMHAIKYAQYHSEPVWAREQFVGAKNGAELAAAVDRVFAGHLDEVARPLRPEDAVVPAISACT